MKDNQISIAMSPGHCKTDMGGPAAVNSAESGAQAIYDCIFMKDPSFEIFYHRGNKYDYVSCGPWIHSFYYLIWIINDVIEYLITYYELF